MKPTVIAWQDAIVQAETLLGLAESTLNTLIARGQVFGGKGALEDLMAGIALQADSLSSGEC